MILRTAANGYETAIAATFVIKEAKIEEARIDLDKFTKHKDNYTIVDVRNVTEVNEGKIFANSISIPLAELRNRIDEIPPGKPIVVHCAGGYRSAAASSLISAKLNGTVTVFDLGEAVKNFQ